MVFSHSPHGTPSSSSTLATVTATGNGCIQQPTERPPSPSGGETMTLQENDRLLATAHPPTDTNTTVIDGGGRADSDALLRLEDQQAHAGGGDPNKLSTTCSSPSSTAAKKRTCLRGGGGSSPVATTAASKVLLGGSGEVGTRCSVTVSQSTMQNHASGGGAAVASGLTPTAKCCKSRTRLEEILIIALAICLFSIILLIVLIVSVPSVSSSSSAYLKGPYFQNSSEY